MLNYLKSAESKEDAHYMLNLEEISPESSDQLYYGFVRRSFEYFNGGMISESVKKYGFGRLVTVLNERDFAMISTKQDKH